jgi:outer membrane protein assembly factor BamA
MKFIFTLFLVMVTGFSQEKNEYQLGDIIINGNFRTKKEVILREILFKKNALVSKTEIEKSVKRIENLHIFTSVKYSLIEDHKNFILLITVYEKFPLFLTPVFVPEGIDPKNLTYGFHFRYLNFLGKNHKISTEWTQGKRESFLISYYNPWIFGENRMSYYSFHSINIEKNISKVNKSIKNTRLGIVFGKGFGPFLKIQSGIVFHQRNYDNELISQSVSGTKYDYNLNLVFSGDYDTRDFYIFPKSGYNIHISSVYNNILKNYSNNSFALSYSVSKFLSYEDFVFAVNLFGNQRFFNPSDYHKISISGKKIVRGHDLKSEITKKIHGSQVEVRYLLTDSFFWTLDLPYLKKYFTRVRTIFFTYSFFDQAFIGSNNFVGYGQGFAVNIPYSKTAYFEYYFNPEAKDHRFYFRLGKIF